jgi:hypothetical protein
MSQANASRTRHSRVQWQTWIDEQAKSGLSEAGFCEQNGISLKRLSHWKRRLRQRCSPTAPEPTLRDEWVELPLASHCQSGWDIELDLGQGLCLRLRRS